LPVVLYDCAAWSLTLREEHGLKVFENRVLRQILGLKRDEVTGEWRKPHSDGLDFSVHLAKYYSGDQIKKNNIGGAYGIWPEWYIREARSGFQWGNLMEGDHLEDRRRWEANT
jgi:hypothetical protein